MQVGGEAWQDASHLAGDRLKVQHCFLFPSHPCLGFSTGL